MKSPEHVALLRRQREEREELTRRQAIERAGLRSLERARRQRERVSPGSKS